MSVFEVRPETHYYEDHGNGLVYTGWKESFQATEVEMCDLLYGLVRMLKPELIVETGTAQGHGTVALAMACADNGRGRVVSCDMEPLTIAKERTGPYPMVKLAQCLSLNLPELKDADFVFSDSGWDSRPREFDMVKKGCVFVVHDAYWPEVRDFVKSNRGMLFNRGRGFGLLVK